MLITKHNMLITKRNRVACRRPGRCWGKPRGPGTRNRTSPPGGTSVSSGEQDLLPTVACGPAWSSIADQKHTRSRVAQQHHSEPRLRASAAGPRPPGVRPHGGSASGESSWRKGHSRTPSRAQPAPSFLPPISKVCRPHAGQAVPLSPCVPPGRGAHGQAKPRTVCVMQTLASVGDV